MQRPSMPPSHFLLALTVTAIWGTNFAIMRTGLETMPPLLFGALRFAIAFLPAALFIRRPDVPWRNLAAYGTLMGTLQFGLLLTALRADISSGLASLVAQAQVFFTIGLAVVLNGERVRLHQWLAVCLASGGMVLIGIRGGGDATPLGVLLMLLSAFSWAVGNMVSRSTPNVNMLGYVVWSSLFAAPPLFFGAVLFDGWEAVTTGLTASGPAVWAAVIWQSVGNTLFGFAVFAWLLARYSAASVAPLTLLVPIFGISASVVLLGETLPGWKLAAAAMVLGGLALNQFGSAARRFKPA